jgi:phosphate transport system substrate-binding protein
MSIAQLDAIFSSTRRCGSDADIVDWGDLGLSGAWSARDIQIFGRNSVSGTYGYFKSQALCKGDFKNTVNEQPGSASVVQSVSTSVNGIGYSGIGYKTSSVRAVPVSKKPGGDAIAATPENAVDGSYPLSRFLYVYVNKAPNKPLALLEREFIKLVYSKQGQHVVSKDGYVALPASVIERMTKSLAL